MTKRALIWIFLSWLVLKLIQYYLLPFFIETFLWVGLSFVLFIVAAFEIFMVIHERKSLSKFRIIKAVFFSTLFWLTYKFSIVNELIEKVDWAIFYNRRANIVENVKENKLQPNENDVCKLPFSFPILSNGGNEIIIDHAKDNSGTTIIFFIYRTYFEGPSTEFIYTNNSKDIKELEQLILADPKNNWKIKNSWYRIIDER